MGYNSLTGVNTVILTEDVINNNAVANTIADITGLSFSVTTTNYYWFRMVIHYTSAIATTGSRWSINGPSSNIYFYVDYSLTAASTTQANGLSAYDTPANANSNTPTNTLSGTAYIQGTAIIEGIMIAGDNGTVIGRFASEVANSAITAKAGSFIHWKQIA
jgi:hypothetical protein